MITVNSSMKKTALLKILLEEFGVELASRTSKTEILEQLEEQGAAVTYEQAAEVTGDANEPAKKERRYVINIFKDKTDKHPVTGCVNGKTFRIERGKNVEVSEAIYNNLTKGAIQLAAETDDDNRVIGTTEVQTYPLTLVEIIE